MFDSPTHFTNHIPVHVNAVLEKRRQLIAWGLVPTADSSSNQIAAVIKDL
jgi:hypothetical protein